MTAASRSRWEKGASSVMHSSISNANEYVSESIVGRAPFISMSSGAAYLTPSPDDTVPTVTFSLVSSVILAISKFQIRGCGPSSFVKTSTFFFAHSAKRLPVDFEGLTHLTVSQKLIVHAGQIYPELTAPVCDPA